jgi:hypothetical protein
LQLLTGASQISAATSGLTATQVDFAHEANGNAYTGAIVTPGDDFPNHAVVVFQSVDTSNQDTVGTVSSYVVAEPGSSAAIISSGGQAGTFAGFDGLRSIFTTPQAVVAVSGSIGQNVPQDSFTLVVTRSDTSQTASFTIPTTASFVSGVQSLCGASITQLDVLPNRNTDSTNHLSTYWQMTNLTYAR